MQFTNLDTLHSYDPLKILKFLYDLIFGGGTDTTKLSVRLHDYWAPFFSNLPYLFINFFAKFVVFSIFFSIAMIILIKVYENKYSQMEDKVKAKVLPKEGEKKESEEGTSVIENPKWKLVQEHINSDDPNKWKLAIIEADIILSELLDKLSLPGDGVGEKLKAVEAGDFNSIEQAWEAHKIRNAIAHQGSDFLLSQREARRIVGLYEIVFSEFEII